jgi:hypothetical protein
MTAWTDRSPEVAALLNPAYCGVILYCAVDGFAAHSDYGMPFELGFLILPLVLHAPTRETIPRTLATTFQTWVNNNVEMRVGLAERLKAAAPLAREAIMFLIVRRCLLLDKSSLYIGTARPKLSSAKIKNVSDVRRPTQAATTLGRLLSRAALSATVFSSLGVEP